MPRQGENNPFLREEGAAVQNQLNILTMTVGELRNAVENLTSNWLRQDQAATDGRKVIHDKIDEVRDNVIVNGSLNIQNYKKAVNENNVVLAKNARRPGESHAIVRPNKYDPSRANVILLNWEKKPALDVDTGTLLKNGNKYRLMNPRDFFGKPILSGTYDGKSIRVPLTGEFAAFVLLRDVQR